MHTDSHHSTPARDTVISLTAVLSLDEGRRADLERTLLAVSDPKVSRPLTPIDAH